MPEHAGGEGLQSMETNILEQLQACSAEHQMSTFSRTPKAATFILIDPQLAKKPDSTL